MKFFASCGKGLEYLLADELVRLGCAHATATIAGANVEGSLADAQRANGRRKPRASAAANGAASHAAARA